MRAFYYINFRVPSNGAPPPGSLHRVPIEKDALFTEPSFNYLLEFMVIGLPMILNRATVEKSAHVQSLLKSLVNEHPAKFPSGAPTVSDFHSRALLPYPSGSPENEPSSFPRQSIHIEGCSPSGALLLSLKIPSKRNPPGSSMGSYRERETELSSTLLSN
jgi:hypothetical protein